MDKLIIGCGYLGQRVAAAWQEQGHTVHFVTRSPERAVGFSARGWIPHRADVCDPGSLASLPEVETVLFCVGYDQHSGKNRQEVMIDGVANVLTVYRDRCRTFLYTSSTSVYGQNQGEWVDEHSPCEPVQPGGICCLAAEQLIWQTFPPSQKTSAAAQVLRLAGLYGPGRLLAKTSQLRLREPLPGRGDAWLNLIHVDDAVACVLASEQLGSHGETYLVCDDQPVQRAEYYSALAELIGAQPPHFQEAAPVSHGSGLLNKRCSNRKLHAHLGITLRYPTYREGLVQAVEA